MLNHPFTKIINTELFTQEVRDMINDYKDENIEDRNILNQRGYMIERESVLGHKAAVNLYHDDHTGQDFEDFEQDILGFMLTLPVEEWEDFANDPRHYYDI